MTKRIYDSVAEMDRRDDVANTQLAHASMNISDPEVSALVATLSSYRRHDEPYRDVLIKRLRDYANELDVPSVSVDQLVELCGKQVQVEMKGLAAHWCGPLCEHEKGLHTERTFYIHVRDSLVMFRNTDVVEAREKTDKDVCCEAPYLIVLKSHH